MSTTHKTGAALPVIAALLGTGQTQMVPQGIKKSRPRIGVQAMPGAVDG